MARGGRAWWVRIRHGRRAAHETLSRPAAACDQPTHGPNDAGQRLRRLGRSGWKVLLADIATVFGRRCSLGRRGPIGIIHERAVANVDFSAAGWVANSTGDFRAAR